jgi:hypothetical protein
VKIVGIALRLMLVVHRLALRCGLSRPFGFNNLLMESKDLTGSDFSFQDCFLNVSFSACHFRFHD